MEKILVREKAKSMDLAFDLAPVIDVIGKVVSNVATDKTFITSKQGRCKFRWVDDGLPQVASCQGLPTINLPCLFEIVKIETYSY